MKINTALLLPFVMLAIFSCETDDSITVPTINGLSLYWDHEVFGDEGRRLKFEGFTINEFDNDHELEFNSSVVDGAIVVRLTNSIDQGKCLYFPTQVVGDDDPNKCNASGNFHLSEKDLDNGVYSLRIVMPAFEITSKLTVTDEKIELKIPPNEFLTSSIENVYPIPPNLLFGSIVYQGSSNTNDAANFLDYLKNIDLIQSTLPNHPYKHLTIDENGHPPVSHWEPDNHSIGFLYQMNNTDFKTIFEQSIEYFNQTNLNIYLYSSNGDQAFMSKSAGITVVYGKY